MKNLSNENVIHITKDGIQYLQFRKLLEYNRIIKHGYSLGLNLNFRMAKMDKGRSLGNALYKVIESYKNICNSIGEDYINVVKTNQEHTDNIQIVNKKVNKRFLDINLEKYKNTDGLITNKPKLLLSTTNADCILMMFFDPVTKTIANIHSGWRGTLKRISVKTVEKMKKEFKCNPKDIICCICPSIRKCHFEVDSDVKEMFELEFQDIEKFNKIIVKQEMQQKWNIDTVLINKIILEQTGLKLENIIDSGICSVCNSNLIHSYRVEKEGYGLATAIITLTGGKVEK